MRSPATSMPKDSPPPKKFCALEDLKVRPPSETVVPAATAMGAVFSETKWKSLSANGARSLIEAELVTGRSHQLRVQFAHMGHPITGDPKYGNEDPSGKKQAESGKRDGSGKPFRGQLLCSCRLEFPPMEGDFAPLSGKVITCGLPPVFHRALARSV